MFDIVKKFENTIANYFGSPYAVSTDSCTHAIELCLIYTESNNVTCPSWTYLSIPMTFEKLKLDWQWEETNWSESYQIGNTNIIDAATMWRQNSYRPKTLFCLSFQKRKHLGLGRGGMILCDSFEDYKILSKMRYDGRDITTSWYEQEIDTMGYHYYMTPETAVDGLVKFEQRRDIEPVIWNWEDYRYLPDLKVFRNIST